ncbi:MAG: flippase [Anaerolineae bacterium]|nr:flippase [Anaerolineae bacterium]
MRLLSNTILFYIGTIVAKASTSLLFIFVGRLLGPEDAGTFNLGITFYTIIFTISAFGLSDILIRDVASRREESGRFLTNFILIRISLAFLAYFFLFLFLQLFSPYSKQTETVILIIALVIFPEAIFSICQALFVAHEQAPVPVTASFINSIVKLLVGFFLLYYTKNIVPVAWILPISSTISLFVFIPAVIHLLKNTVQEYPNRFDFSFSFQQLRYTKGFILIGLFSTLDFQTDSFLISILLDETRLGWYGAAQTIMLGFWMMPVAIRTAIYPIMSRYHHQDVNKLASFYDKINRYLVIFAFPIAIFVSIMAKPIILLVFTESFAPSAPALSIMIWSVVFAFLDAPNARLMLINNKQQQIGWITGISMLTSLLINIWLIPIWGILGASLARVLSSFVFFLLIFVYVHNNFINSTLPKLLIRPVLAGLLMALIVWLVRAEHLVIGLFLGMTTYGITILLLKGIPDTDREIVTIGIYRFYKSLATKLR